MPHDPARHIPDYSFIAKAGRSIGKGVGAIADYTAAKRALEEKEVDLQQTYDGFVANASEQLREIDKERVSAGLESKYAGDLAERTVVTRIYNPPTKADYEHPGKYADYARDQTATLNKLLQNERAEIRQAKIQRAGLEAVRGEEKQVSPLGVGIGGAPGVGTGAGGPVTETREPARTRMEGLKFAQEQVPGATRKEIEGTAVGLLPTQEDIATQEAKATKQRMEEERLGLQRQRVGIARQRAGIAKRQLERKGEDLDLKLAFQATDDIRALIGEELRHERHIDGLKADLKEANEDPMSTEENKIELKYEIKEAEAELRGVRRDIQILEKVRDYADEKGYFKRAREERKKEVAGEVERQRRAMWGLEPREEQGETFRAIEKGFGPEAAKTFQKASKALEDEAIEMLKAGDLRAGIVPNPNPSQRDIEIVIEALRKRRGK